MNQTKAINLTTIINKYNRTIQEVFALVTNFKKLKEISLSNNKLKTCIFSVTAVATALKTHPNELPTTWKIT